VRDFKTKFIIVFASLTTVRGNFHVFSRTLTFSPHHAFLSTPIQHLQHLAAGRVGLFKFCKNMMQK